MTRTLLAAFVFSSLALTAASAQDFTAEQRAACKGDYETFCKGTLPGGGRVLACLSKNNDKLSAACKKVVADAKK
ncbi:MAG: hypothetical protein JSR61_01635 [Proteobacteria bacterium]|nr:hypothetical protein [Pseudomonadota bacterium]